MRLIAMILLVSLVGCSALKAPINDDLQVPEKNLPFNPDNDLDTPALEPEFEPLPAE